MRVARRIAVLAIATLVLATALLGAAFVSSYRADAGTVLALAGVDDVVRALRQRGLDVDRSGTLIAHPLVSVIGEELLVDGEAVVVYVFPSVEKRVEADHLLRSQLRIVVSDSGMPPGSTRIVAARDVLMLHAVESEELALQIYQVARDIAG